jgi:hypothetical protein
MTGKQLLRSMVLVFGLVSTILVFIPDCVVNADDMIESSFTNNPDGSTQRTETYKAGGTTTTVVGKDGSYTVTEADKDGKVLSQEKGTKYGQPGNAATKTDKDGNVTKYVPYTTPSGSTGANTVVHDKNGNLVSYTNFTEDPKGYTKTTRDGKGNITTTETATTYGTGSTGIATKDGNGQLIKETRTWINPDGSSLSKTTDFKTGTVVTDNSNGKGLTTSTTTDKSGKTISTTTSTYDKTTGSSTVKTTDSTGNSTTRTYDNSRILTGATTTDKNGSLVSKTSYSREANGNLHVETYGKDGKLVSETVYDKKGKIVQQIGKPQTIAVGQSGQATGGTQTTQGKGKHKDKQLFQAGVVQQNKEKPKAQDWGSSSASSGSTGQMQHHRGKH